MKIKSFSILDSFVIIGIFTLALAAIMKYADYAIVRFFVATGLSLMETLGLVVFVESIKERRNKK